MAREYFCAYHSLLRQMQNLSDAECGRLFRALLTYSESGELINLQGREIVAFDFAKYQIDRDREAYDAKCSQNATNVSKRYDRIRPNTTVYDRNKEEEKEEEKEKEEYKKESKKESAPTNWAENVTMTNEEHDKLVSAHGEADTARLIEILDNYKGSTGKRYKSDYRAILSWCVDRLAEEKGKAKPGAKAPLVQSSAGDAEAAMVRRLNT